MQVEENNPLLITAREAWTLCGMKKSAWYRNLSRKAVPAPVRVNGFVRWRRQELLDWINAGCPSQAKWLWKPQKK